jgi:hypothetical protein
VFLDPNETRVMQRRFTAMKGLGAQDEAAAGGNAAHAILSQLLK